MDFIVPDIEKYALGLSSAEDPVLAELSRETHLKMLSPRMLSGRLQGSFLSMISSMLQPSRILEIGTFTGYSAICLAKGLRPGGILTTMDANEEIESIARKYFRASGLDHQIELLIGNALHLIPGLVGSIDLVFIDADKKNYCNYYDLVFDKIRPGGFILADNVLWSGKVLNDETKMDAETFAIHDFNRKVINDDRVEALILPIRDGLTLIRKK
jgi:caffeoyl-CoA O-methyltransferase